jgi:flagellar hook-length control protein FliK
VTAQAGEFVLAVSLIQPGPTTAAKSGASTGSLRPAEDRARDAQAEQFQGVLAAMQLVSGIQSTSESGSTALPEDALFEDPGARSPDAPQTADHAEAPEDGRRHDARRGERTADQNSGQQHDVPGVVTVKAKPVEPAGTAVATRSEASLTSAGPAPDRAQANVATDGATQPAGHVRPAAMQQAAATSPLVANTAGVQLRDLSAGARGAESPARQVAQILGAARGGESSESTAAPGGAALRQPVAASPRNQSPGRDAQSDLSLSQGRSDGETGEIESAERTPFEKLIRSARTQVGSRVSSARLVLDPPELGRLDVQVRMEAGRVSIGVKTETPEARELLKLRGDELKTALEQHGLHVERFDVTLESDGAVASFGDRGYGSGNSRPEERQGNREGAGRSGAAGAVAAGESGTLVVDAATSLDPSRRLDIRV